MAKDSQITTDLFRSLGPCYLHGNNYIRGTSTNDSADSGFIGEILKSSTVRSAPIALTTATTANITSVSLTAGDWDVFGQTGYTGTAAAVNAFASGISTTSATLPPADTSNVPSSNQVSAYSLGLLATSDLSIPIYCNISLASTTTIYLVGVAVFAAGTANAYGSITARRSR